LRATFILGIRSQREKLAAIPQARRRSPVAKKEWRKPEIKTIKAGSAETGTGPKGDSSGGGSIHS